MYHEYVIAQGSAKFVLVPFFISLVAFFLEAFILNILFLIIAIYFLWFFRDPIRAIDKNENIIYAPADGTVVFITNENEEIKISIRMSPFNVHLNRSPIDGVVKHIEYKPGKHSNVYFGDAEQKNEQNLIVIENKNYISKILQITGFFARRLECWVEHDQQVSQGDKIGIIRFGSQTNLLISSNDGSKTNLNIECELGDKVYAGITPLASIER